MKSIFDFPKLYEKVLYRNTSVIKDEVESIQLFAKNNIKKDSYSILEIACGSCAHGIPLALKGNYIWGIDISESMLDVAKAKAKISDVNIRLSKKNFINFTISKKDFDLAIFMYESFPLITKMKDVISHFNSVRRHIRTSGFYILDIDSCKQIRMKKETWSKKTIKIEDGNITFWNQDYPGNWIESLNHMALFCDIKIGSKRFKTKDEWLIKVYSPWSLVLLVKNLIGWKLNGFFSWKKLRENYFDDDHYFMVLEVVNNV